MTEQPKEIPQGFMVDPTVTRAEVLMGLSHHVVNTPDDVMKGMLLRYAECIVQEQEMFTANTLKEDTTVH